MAGDANTCSFELRRQTGGADLLLTVTEGSNNYQLSLKDAVGCRVLRVAGETRVDVQLISYRLVGKRRKRQLQTVPFKSEDGALNQQQANQLCTAVSSQLRAERPPHLNEALSQRRLLVIANPVSGKGSALKRARSAVLPLLHDAAISFELLLTGHRNHAFEIASQLDINAWSGVVIAAGDGIVHEFINGLVSRPDRELALSLPIAHAPCGSGNALAASILYDSGTPFPTSNHLLESACSIPRPTYKHVNLLHVETLSGKHRTAFLSFEFGLTAELEVNTASWRPYVGAARIPIGMVVGIMARRSHRARISYLVCEERMEELRKHADYISEASKQGCCCCSPPNRVQKESKHELPQRKTTEDFHQAKTVPEIAPVEGFTSAGESEGNNEFWHLYDALPPLRDAPVGASWVELEDEFLLVIGISLSHMASDLPYLPLSKLDHDCFYLTFIRNEPAATRLQLLKDFTSIDTGKHFCSPCLEVIPVKAVRVEPLTAGSSLCFDGEFVDCEPFQISLSSLKATVMT